MDEAVWRDSLYSSGSPVGRSGTPVVASKVVVSDSSGGASYYFSNGS